jgi:hypothetical protein
MAYCCGEELTRGGYDRTFLRKDLPVPIEQLEHEYVDLTMPVSAISKKHNGYSASIIYNRLKERGVKFRPFGCASGVVTSPGNFDRYPLSAYRESPCGNENPFCIILRDFFRKMDKDERGCNVPENDRVKGLWEMVYHGGQGRYAPEED